MIRRGAARLGVALLIAAVVGACARAPETSPAVSPSRPSGFSVNSPASPAPGPRGAPGDHTLHGLVTSTSCGKFGLYDLVNASVEVRDEHGAVIGTGITGTRPHPFCHIPFTVSALPTARRYQIRIGTENGPSYGLRTLRRKGWSVAFTMGD